MKVKYVSASPFEHKDEFFMNRRFVLYASQDTLYLPEFVTIANSIEVIDIQFAFGLPVIKINRFNDQDGFEEVVVCATQNNIVIAIIGEDKYVLMEVEDKELWGITYQWKEKSSGKMGRCIFPNYTFFLKKYVLQFITDRPTFTSLLDGDTGYEGGDVVYSDFKPVLIDTWIEE